MVGSRARTITRRRTGFTLIELMIAIVIIAILIGLLLPAVRGAITSARITGVKNEIGQLESAIAQFKASHGIEPPSLIFLYETGTVNAHPNTGWANDPTSTALIRQMWPQYNFAADIDINGDGTISAPGQIQLSVGECLVFFLGGMNGNITPGSTSASNNIAGNIGACTGFSKDPTSPFSRGGGSREPPLFEFVVSRFTDLNGNGFPEYKDTLPTQSKPYLYYSSYDGLGYQEGTEFGGGGLTVAYRQPSGSGAPVWNLSDPYWKPNSYQIISAGYDQQYGYGGDYVPTGSTRLPIPTIAPLVPTAAQRAFEADNITNFAQGVLQP